MEYLGEEALGPIETKGMVPAIEAADVMGKTADALLSKEPLHLKYNEVE